jgi:hypothetical protein
MESPISQKTKNFVRLKKLTLTLLVLRVGADYAHHATAMNHLALVTNLFHASPNFHTVLLLFLLTSNSQKTSQRRPI